MKLKSIVSIFFVTIASIVNGQKPNIVVITTDDVAPMDISCYHRGLGAVKTPNIDRIADKGMILTDFYAHPSCTAGRAGFINGQYPIRTGLTSVGQPGSKLGQQANDVSLATLLKDKGYATGQFGKHHLGDRNEHLPTVHGFDEFYGLLYHLNMMDMIEQSEFPKDPNFVGRPRNVLHTYAIDVDDKTVDPRFGKVGKQTIVDCGELGAKRQETFDDEVLEKTIAWLNKEDEEDDPFFLWFCPARMHQKIFVSDEWKGKSGHGEYADALLHLDHIIGELLDELERLGKSENTIVLFTSDNGVNLRYFPSGGTASFRGEKGTSWEGAYRVPMMIKWPGKVEPGSYSGGLMSVEDWLPTLMAAVGEENIKDELLEGKTVNGREYNVHLDGYNQMDMLTGNGESNRHEFFYYAETDLMAVRYNHWKVYFSIKDEWERAAEVQPAGLLVDIKLDPYERTIETPGHFNWQRERTWVLPLFAPPIQAFVKSLEEYPPQLAGAGIGIAPIMKQLNAAADIN